MFTGIIEELGQVRQISRRGKVSVLEVEAKAVLEGTKIGDSISVNGVCLTVVAKGRNTLDFEVIAQTLKATNIGSLKLREKINLERSLKVGGRVSGHFVLGHVDFCGIIRSKRLIQDNLVFEAALPVEYMKYTLPQGSVALDGISLTIAGRKPAGFTVCIIPHTLKNTTLSFKGCSDRVNIEFDILAKSTALTR